MHSAIKLVRLAVVLILVGGVPPAGPTNAQVDPAFLDQVARATVRIAALVIKSENDVRTEHRIQALGSGTVVSRDGLILTNRHVVVDEPNTPLARLREDLDAEMLAFAGANMDLQLTIEPKFLIYVVEGLNEAPYRRFTAEKVPGPTAPDGVDLAQLRITGDGGGQPLRRPVDRPYVELGDSDSVGAPNRVYLFGYPEFGTPGSIESTTISYGKGSVARLYDPPGLGDPPEIHLDATIGGGSSGGPVVAAGDGKLIGITTRDLNDELGGLAKVIPVNQAKPLIDAAASDAPPAPAPGATAMPTPSPTSGPAPSVRTYTSPEHGWRISWNEEVWELAEPSPDDSSDVLLRANLSTLSFTVAEDTEDPKTCVESLGDEAAAAAGVDEHASEEVAEDADRASAVYVFTFDPDDGKAFEVRVYAECRVLPQGEALLQIYYLAPALAFEDRIGEVQAVLATIGIDDAPRAAQPSVDQPSSTLEPTDTPPATRTPTPESGSASTPASGAYTSLEHGWSVSWDDRLWELGDEQGDSPYELELDNPHGGWVDFEVNDHDDVRTCVEEERYILGRVDGFSNLETVEEVSGDENRASAVYGFTIGTGQLTREYVECRPLVPGETMLRIIYSEAADAYTDGIGEVQQLLGTIEIDHTPPGHVQASDDRSSTTSVATDTPRAVTRMIAGTAQSRQRTPVPIATAAQAGAGTVVVDDDFNDPV